MNNYVDGEKQYKNTGHKTECRAYEQKAKRIIEKQNN
jgi:hypothetical protein